MPGGGLGSQRHFGGRELDRLFRPSPPSGDIQPSNCDRGASPGSQRFPMGNGSAGHGCPVGRRRHGLGHRPGLGALRPTSPGRASTHGVGRPRRSRPGRPNPRGPWHRSEPTGRGGATAATDSSGFEGILGTLLHDPSTAPSPLASSAQHRAGLHPGLKRSETCWSPRPVTSMPGRVPLISPPSAARVTPIRR